MNVTVTGGEAKVTRITDFTEAVGFLGCQSEKSVGKCDILSVISVGAPPSWHVNKDQFPDGFLAECGLTCSLCVLSASGLDEWVAAIEKAKPKIVLIRALLCDELVVEILAQRYPRIAFVSVCHSALAFAATVPHIIVRAAKLIELSRRYRNVYYAHANSVEVEALRRVYKLDGKIIWLPNVVHRVGFSTKAYDPCCISIFLCCVWRSLKNMLGQIFAVAYAARFKRIKFHLSVPNVGVDADIAELIKVCQEIPDFDVEMVSWKNTPEYLEWMAQNIDIVMQCSFTDSFNYVAWEAMSLGIPVVGSAAVTFCPDPVNPDCVVSMGKRIVDIIDLYDTHSKLARTKADAERVRLYDGYRDSIRYVLEGLSSIL